MMDPNHRRGRINQLLYAMIFLDQEVDDAVVDRMADNVLQHCFAAGPAVLVQAIREAIAYGDPFHGPGRGGDLLNVPRSDEEIRTILGLVADRVEQRLADDPGPSPSAPGGGEA